VWAPSQGVTLARLDGRTVMVRVVEADEDAPVVPAQAMLGGGAWATAEVR
jgi:hypothetical protein